MDKKIRLIYGPFLLIGLSFIGVYTLINWCCSIQLGWVFLNEDVINLWLPLLLPLLPILIWLQPRLSLMRLKVKGGTWATFYMAMATLAIGIPALLAQDYLFAATGSLATLHTIGEIHAQPLTKYYRLQQYYIDKDHGGVYRHTYLSGKYNSTYNMAIYIALPVFNSATDTAGKKADCWLGYAYKSSTGNYHSAAEKDTAFHHFAVESRTDFEARNFDSFTYLLRPGNTDDHQGYDKALLESPKHGGANNIVFEAEHDVFETRTGHTFQWMIASFLIGALAWLGLLLIPKLDDEEVEKFEHKDII